MKNKIEEITEYSLGSEIADQIADIMKIDAEISDLENYPELKKWLENDETSVNVTEKLSSQGAFTKLCEEFNRTERKSEKIRLIQSIEKKRKRTRSLTILKLSSGVAALLILSFVLFVEKKTPSTSGKSTMYSTQRLNSTVLTPTLILDNGENIDLAVVEKIGHAIEKTEKSKLNYKNAKTENIAYNTLIVPKLHIFDIELSDSTFVTLNANSKLRYPIEFKAGPREVFLEGEGYFRVKKGSQPFIVHAENASITVYGTQFNVNSFHKEKIQTTLVEGVVGVRVKSDREVEIRMKPNQMMINDSQGKTELKEVDVSRYIAWMNGEIISYNETLPNLLDKISRWYGIEFVYSNEINNINISTSFNTDTVLDELLSGIKGATGVKITKINENKYEVIQ